MLRFIYISVAFSVLLFGLDYYVFRHWRHFAGRRRSKLNWTVPVYRVLMFVMPLAMPVYFYLSRWWDVEPKLPRALFFAVWATYYLPKLPIVLVLLLKDMARFTIWLFDWFKVKLSPVEDVPERQADRLDLTDMNRMTRGVFLQKMGWTAASIPFVVVGYSTFRSLYHFEVHRVVVPIQNLPAALEGLTIAQLSDLHAGSFFSERPVEEAIDLVAGLRPDLITITGDFVNHDIDELPIILPALNRLKADLGVYGCLGNHDHYARVDALTERLKATTVDLMVNEHRSLRIGDATLHLIGTDNTGFRQHYGDLEQATSGIRSDENGEETRILLAHDPTFWDSHVRPGYADIDLMLCGHTHGGQIGFEFGPLRWGLARVAYPRWAGLYAEPRSAYDGQQFLYVNRGLGTVGPPVRLGIRPEITLLTLKRA